MQLPPEPEPEGEHEHTPTPAEAPEPEGEHTPTPKKKQVFWQRAPLKAPPTYTGEVVPMARAVRELGLSEAWVKRLRVRGEIPAFLDDPETGEYILYDPMNPPTEGRPTYYFYLGDLKAFLARRQLKKNRQNQRGQRGSQRSQHNPRP